MHVCFNASLMETKLTDYVKSCSVHFVGIALKNKKFLGWKTKPRCHITLGWNTDHSVRPIYMWKSKHKRGIGISMVNEGAPIPLSPDQLLFQFLLPVLRKQHRT